MAWIILVTAAGFEIVWAIGLKYTDGFTRLWPTVGTVLAMIISVVAGAWRSRACLRNSLCGLDRHRRGRHCDPGDRPPRGGSQRRQAREPRLIVAASRSQLVTPPVLTDPACEAFDPTTARLGARAGS